MYAKLIPANSCLTYVPSKFENLWFDFGYTYNQHVEKFIVYSFNVQKVHAKLLRESIILFQLPTRPNKNKNNLTLICLKSLILMTILCL